MIPPLEIRALFDRLAPGYDLLNRVLSGWRDVYWRRAAAEVLLPPPGPLLDLACGTLDLTLDLARTYPDRRILGLDFSLTMIRSGRPKLGPLDQAQVFLLAGDGQRLPFRDQTFGGATVGFGVRNFTDRPAALREINRVLVPGGRLAILECGLPGGLIEEIYKIYLLKLIPRLARLVSPNPAAYTYLGDSILAFPRPPEFVELMSQAGFRAKTIPLTRGVCWLFIGTKVRDTKIRSLYARPPKPPGRPRPGVSKHPLIRSCNQRYDYSLRSSPSPPSAGERAGVRG